MAIKKEKTKKGVHYTIYTNYTTPQGTKKRFKKVFSNQADAEYYESILKIVVRKESCIDNEFIQAKLNEYDAFLNGVSVTTTEPEKPSEKIITLKNVYDEWMETISPTVAPNTAYDVVKCFRQCEPLAEMDIRDISISTIRSFFNARSDRGYEMNRSVKKTLTRLFNLALELEYVQKNPVDLLKKVPGIKKEKEDESEKIINYNDLVALTDILNSMSFLHRNYAIFNWICFYTGLRKAEALALRKDDIDLEHNTICVSKQLQYKGLKKGSFYTKDPKSASSSATIPFTDALKEILIPWFEENPFNLVICDADGEYISPDSMDNTCRALAKKLGFKWKAHNLRHTFCSNVAIYGTNNIKIAQMLMRHSSSRTTLDVYTHVPDINNKQILDDTFTNLRANCDPKTVKCVPKNAYQLS